MQKHRDKGKKDDRTESTFLEKTRTVGEYAMTFVSLKYVLLTGTRVDNGKPIKDKLTLCTSVLNHYEKLLSFWCKDEQC